MENEKKQRSLASKLFISLIVIGFVLCIFATAICIVMPNIMDKIAKDESSKSFSKAVQLVVTASAKHFKNYKDFINNDVINAAGGVKTIGYSALGFAWAYSGIFMLLFILILLKFILLLIKKRWVMGLMLLITGLYIGAIFLLQTCGLAFNMESETDKAFIEKWTQWCILIGTGILVLIGFVGLAIESRREKKDKTIWDSSTTNTTYVSYE